MFGVKAVVSGMSVSLKGNASVMKTWKMLDGHVQVQLLSIPLQIYEANIVVAY